jgi:hypothetical protein
MKKFIKSMLSSSNDVSSKRVIGILSAISIIIISFIDLLSNYKITDYVFEGLVWLAVAGLFFVASEKFSEFVSATKNKP